MSLDGAGLGLAIFAEFRTIVKSIQEHKSCYKEAPALFADVDETLSRLMAIADILSLAVGANPDAVPEALRQVFLDTLSAVKEKLLQAESAVKLFCERAFFGSGGSQVCCLSIANKCKRFLKSKSLKASMTTIHRDVRDAEAMLQSLCTQLCTALKVDDLRDFIKEHATPQEKFVPAFNAPALPANIHLDFESRDADGKFAAPEGTLKSTVYISTCPRHVTVARGAGRLPGKQGPLHGVSGMAGVGKTTALIGLGHDEDIREHFNDGVLYVSIGANATVGHITTELWKIMSITGSMERAAAVQSAKSVEDAIAIASVWFHGKRILFLIDDIWPTPTRPEGYLPNLEELLQGSVESRMAISTRSLHIAAKGGSHVDFGARDPFGPTSLSIFLAHALPGVFPSDNLLNLARNILLLCAGLPISLSVAGSAVALRVNCGDDFEDACEMYLEKIQTRLMLHPGASFLNNAIELSISALGEHHERTVPELAESTEYSLRELYISLCVLKNQQFAPISVLARMWNVSYAIADSMCVSFSSMSLAKISTQVLDGRKQSGLYVHDLHLDFMRENARRSHQDQIWHRRLLSGHMPINDSLTANVSIDGINDLRGFNILEYSPRLWWKDDVPNREYIRINLSRHLRSGGLDLELGATMLDVRWVAAQETTGGVLQVNNDMDLLQEAVQEKGVFAGSDEPLSSVTIISDTIAGMGEIMKDGIRIITQELYAHLTCLSLTNEWIHRFLQKMKEVTPAPFLVPTAALYRHPVEDLKLLIELSLPGQKEFAYFSTDFSTCDKYCTAGVNHDVVVYNLENRSRLKWLKGHKENVSIVKFNSGSSKLVSGSFDKRVIVWDWRESDLPHLVLEGHEGTVTSLSLDDGKQRLYSGSLDGAVRVWDMVDGSLLREIKYGSEVECVSSCEESELIAVGTRDGRLRCTNSESVEIVFEYSVGGSARISAVQFGPDGKVLVCGTSEGKATLWSRTSDWETCNTVSIPGSVTHVSFHANGTNAILGSSLGEIRHWVVSEQELSEYNLSVARPVTGLSFFNCGRDIIVAMKLGYARAWTGPLSNPILDFTSYRNNILIDFDLSADGSRVATSTCDGMIRVWNSDTGTQVAGYSAPVDGSQRLALSANGAQIASSSSSGSILVWSAENPPSDANILLSMGEKSCTCLSFSPDGKNLLICVEHGVEIWKLESRAEKQGHFPNAECFNASFSADGRHVIVGNPNRTSIWSATESRKVFDSAGSLSLSSPSMSLPEAKHVIRTCGVSALRLWPPSFRNTEELSRTSERAKALTVNNIFNFVSNTVRPSNMQFSESVFVQNFCGTLLIFKLWK